ncbi:MAG: ROK family transcriptional regulator [Nocardioides marinisabuli]|uniref:ROK family transcriptional regulator n=1 Tax=Nocardioides marinisabuli TaxID=419476 RepID=UPI003219B23D
MSRRPSLTGSSATADQVAVRRHNLSLVLGHLRRHGDRSRARVAEETGLNKATVSSLVAELVERGLVSEGEAERGGVGRPAQAVGLDGRHLVALGAEINIDYLSVLALDLRGELVAERRVALDTAGMEPTRVLGELARVVREVLDGLDGRSRPVGLTVAVPGLVETATGTVFDAPNLRWQRTAAVAQLCADLDAPDYPVTLDNEANLAAVAELAARADAPPDDLLLLTGGAGVGGGMVAGGRLLRGGQGFAGEVGHMRVERAGTRCGCGRTGCWETVVGLHTLLRLAADEGDPVRDPARDLVQRLDELRGRAAAGDTRTLAALTEVADWLTVGAGILVNVLNPQVLVLGGYFAALGPWFAEALEAGLQQEVFAPGSGGCRVEMSTLGFSAAVRGGALQALSVVFDDPTRAGLAPPAPTTDDLATGATR